ncbi:GDNF-inducible zinc finger protein 1-like [Trichogramma pretiosum]|uniref:GDNF-inducible zinc finger protein 1-like n=1 Tax=Trichogramma pretiosum TaxID=7493 RepID=UPI0006C96F76|nr:GDNF-inducible zinc finger protein 1-like [Trichogramma pretiosum]
MEFDGNKMDSYSLLNVAARIKDEPVDELFTVNDGHEVTEKTSTIQNVQTFTIKQENSTHRFKKCDETRENEHEDLRIELECREQKPKFNSGLKIEDSSENYLQDMSRRWTDENNIKKESFVEVKKEPVEDDPDDLVTNDDLGGQKKSRTSIDTRPKGATFSCHKCKKTFKHKPSLKHHIKSVHEGIRYPCDICGTKFATKGNLEKHMDSVHNKITHPCNMCEKTFTAKNNIKKHIDSVHSKIAHACDICGKSFSQKSYLKIHIDVMHIDNIKHACDICGKKFAVKCGLKNHIDEVHNGVTHACNICGKSFTRKGSVKGHIDKIHQGGTTHACDICEKKFMYKSSLNWHVKSSHRTTLTEKTENCQNAN